MTMVRIIPCLDVRDGRVVKGVRFSGLRDAGDPAERARLYAEQGADELVVLDVTATLEGRGARLLTVAAVRRELDIPLTVGGGVDDLRAAAALLEAGADKVAVNSAAVNDPTLLTRLAQTFGSQCCVLAIDAKRDAVGFQVRVRSGGVGTPRDAVAWAKEGVERGAGEILLTSFDRDGTREGFDLELLRAVRAAVEVPIIASGGASRPEHFLEAIASGADAVLAASLFHDGDASVSDVKQWLLRHGAEVRS